MRISGVEFNFNFKAIEFYVSGCSGRCPGCHNKELWDFNIGVKYKHAVNSVKESLNSQYFDKIWILGGEPLDQDLLEMERFLYILQPHKKTMWLWTSGSVDDVFEFGIYHHFDRIKTGAFIEERFPQAYMHHIDGLDIPLASSNQYIKKIKRLRM